MEIPIADAQKKKEEGIWCGTDQIFLTASFAQKYEFYKEVAFSLAYCLKPTKYELELAFYVNFS